jgi:hypothetical protein
MILLDFTGKGRAVPLIRPRPLRDSRRSTKRRVCPAYRAQTMYAFTRFPPYCEAKRSALNALLLFKDSNTQAATMVRALLLI